jgi:acyl dehydratase
MMWFNQARTSIKARAWRYIVDGEMGAANFRSQNFHFGYYGDGIKFTAPVPAGVEIRASFGMDLPFKSTDTLFNGVPPTFTYGTPIS